MKKQMKRTVYEAPIAERFQVELEGVFCASIVMNESGVSIAAQDINTQFDGDSFIGNGEDDHNGWVKEGGWQ